jgi:hypothetical protein
MIRGSIHHLRPSCHHDEELFMTHRGITKPSDEPDDERETAASFVFSEDFAKE